jgi:hypothetical protein
MNEFKPSSWNQDPQDLAKEFTAYEDAQCAPEEQQTAPEEFSKQLVRRGVLDAQTGLVTGHSKQKHLTAWQPSDSYKDSYQRTFGHA